MRDVYIAGVGMTQFGKHIDTHVIQLGVDACINAIKDSCIDKKDIQVAYCGSARTGQLHGRESGVGQSILWRIGITGIPVTSVANFCASGGTAFREAWIAVGSGMFDVAIAVGVEKLNAKREAGRPLTSDGLELLTSLGFTPPLQYAQVAMRYMYETGATAEDFALVAVKNRANAVMNPYAQRRSAVTIEEVLNSTPIAKPLTRLSCSPIADGAAAIVLCSRDYIERKLTTKHRIKVGGVGLRSGYYGKKRDYLSVKAEEVAAQDAYKMAGIGPDDVNLAEVHDAFTPGEIIHYENLGFCGRGEGIKFIKDGHSKITGKLPVNPSGGLLAKGHPLGATGIGQIVELVWHMRGEAGERQVAKANIALAHCSGGFSESPELGESQSTSVVILKK